MKIFFDTSVMPLFPNGIAVYEIELLKALFASLNKDELKIFSGINSVLPERHAVFYHKINSLLGERINFVRRYFPARFGSNWQKIQRLLTTGSDNYDLCHAPANGFPAWIPFDYEVPLVLTLHDVVFMRYQDGPGEQAYYELMQKIMVPHISKASAVITVSEFSRREILDIFSINPELVHVTPLGCQLPKDIPADPKILVRNNIEPKRYFMAVGVILERKNYSNLIKAFLRYKDLKKNNNTKLVIVGNPAPGTEVLQEKIAKAGADVIWLQKVTNQELAALYLNAVALFQVSRYEGFGLPVIEAMSLGCPVCYGLGSSMDELCPEKTAIPVAPDDVCGISENMKRLAEDIQLQESLAESGKLNARKYSWEKTAQLTLSIYKNVLKK